MVSKNKNVFSEDLSQWFFGLGILFLLFGFVLMVFPVAGTITVEILFGIVFLFLGIFQLVASFIAKKWSGFIFVFLCGLVSLVLGLFLLFDVLEGLILITLLLGFYLLIQGAIKFVWGLSTRTKNHRTLFLFDGIISLLLGCLIIIGWPADSLWVIGLLFGIYMFFGGLTFLFLSKASK